MVFADEFLKRKLQILFVMPWESLNHIGSQTSASLNPKPPTFREVKLPLTEDGRRKAVARRKDSGEVSNVRQ